jgi:hypothetical protein
MPYKFLFRPSTDIKVLLGWSMIQCGSLAYSMLSSLSSKTSELVDVPEEADGPGDGSDMRTRSNSGEWETVLPKLEHVCSRGLQGAVSISLRILSPSDSSGI